MFPRKRWLEEQPAAQDVFFCDKEALDAEMKAAMAAADKKERKALTKAFDTRRKELEALAEAVGEEALPAMGQSLMSLLKELQPALREANAHCVRLREAVAKLQPDARREKCRVFYDGTSDAAYSNFKPYRFSIGRLGFLKGEQFFHVAKALLCRDVPAAVRMMQTTGGPALRRMGREVNGYAEHGAPWEAVDSGLLLLVCVIVKIAQLQPAYAEANAALIADLKGDGAQLRDGRLLYIAEGAKDDDRCGIGIHADNADLFERMDAWGRNQLGHASQMVAMWLERKGEDDAPPAKKQRSFGETSLAAALPEEQRRPRRSSDSAGLRAAYCNIDTCHTGSSESEYRTHIEFRALREGEDVMENLRYPESTGRAQSTGRSEGR